MVCSFVESAKKQFCNDDNNIADQFTSILDDYYNEKKECKRCYDRSMILYLCDM